jgi:hypothetical protein
VKRVTAGLQNVLTNALFSLGFIVNIGAKFAAHALDVLKLTLGEYAKVS